MHRLRTDNKIMLIALLLSITFYANKKLPPMRQLLFYIFKLDVFYIIPGIPPIGGIAGSSFLISTIPASVVRSIADADEAF